MVNELATISGTAVAAAPGFFASVKSNLASWAIGVIAVPLAFKWLSGKGVQMLMAWELSEVHKLLDAKTGDPALDVFEKDLVLALVKFAQAKFPEGGLGPDRKAWAVAWLTQRVPFFKGQEERLGIIIDQIVALQKEVLNQISAK